MTTSIRTRPRLDEFFLALLWIVGTTAWGYFGVIGYGENIAFLDSPRFNVSGFVVSFFFLCLTVFGIRYALNTFLRLWLKAPGWVDTLASLTLGLILALGTLFSLFSLVVVAAHIFTVKDNLIFAWGLGASLAIAGLAVFQFMGTLNAFEPFVNGTASVQNPFLLSLIKFSRRFRRTPEGIVRTGDQVRGPLLLEADPRTGLSEEKTGGRPGLEKTFAAHGGYHVSTLGFTANGANVFTVSDGGMVHFQAGGRKGVMFPPEVKFWDWNAGRVQSATLGTPQTFLTSQYQTPAGLQDYRFLVPQAGGKFAWAKPGGIEVGNWNNDRLQSLVVEEGLMLRGKNGFAPIAFTPDGSRLAWCAEDGQTRFWNLETEQVQPLRAYPVEIGPAQPDPESGVWGLTFSPDGTRVATLGGQGILLQNVYTGWRWFRAIEPRREKLTAFAFSPSGFEMVVAMSTLPGAIQLGHSARRGRQPNPAWALQTQAEALSRYEPTELVPIVRLWDLREDRFVDLLAGESPLRELAFSPDNRMLAAVDEGGLLRLWELAAEGILQHPPQLVLQLDLGLTGRKVVVIFSPDMERLICATDNRILIWNLARLRQEAPV